MTRTSNTKAQHERDWGSSVASGTVRGIRMFYVDSRLPLLVGHWGITWSPGENIGRCILSRGIDRSPMHLYEDHEVADQHCSCGFYAYWGIGEIPAYQSASPVFGVIDGYGTALIGSKGFRSSRARILGITPNPEAYQELSRDALRQVSRHYGVSLLPDVDALLTADLSLAGGRDAPVIRS